MCAKGVLFQVLGIIPVVDKTGMQRQTGKQIYEPDRETAKHTDKQADRQTNRQRDRQTESKTDRQYDTYTQRLVRRQSQRHS